MVLNYYMNIVDTSTNSKTSRLYKSIKNIPLFEIVSIDYDFSDTSITDIIFQSVAAVENFKHFEVCEESKVFAMGESTKQTLKDLGIDATISKTPGSLGLKELLGEELAERKFAIVKGLGGLDELNNHIIKSGALAENLICYKRKELTKYEEMLKDFSKADVVIFSSTFAAKIFFENIYISNSEVSFVCISERIKKYINNLGFKAKTINYFSDDLINEIKKVI